MQRSVVLSAFLLCLLLVGIRNTIAQAQAKTHRVVFAVTSGEEEDWKLVMNNMRNLLLSFGDTPYEVEVVAFGPGIAMLKAPSAVGAEIAAMQAVSERTVQRKWEKARIYLHRSLNGDLRQ